jgi:hypothetical protein
MTDPEQMDREIQHHVRERKANGPVTCDVPDCSNRWRGYRKLGWEPAQGGPVTMVLFFLCRTHLAMPHAKLLEVAPLGIPALDNAPDAPDPRMQ